MKINNYHIVKRILILINKPLKALRFFFRRLRIYVLSRVQNAQIGSGCRLGKQVVLRGSKLAGDDHIDSNVTLINSNIDLSVIIEKDSVINGCNIGRFVKIQQRVELIHTNVDNYCYIAPQSRAIVTSFGRFCSIGPNAVIGCGNHPTTWISTSPVFYSVLRQCGISFAKNTSFEELKPVTIGCDCWIGANVVILNGVNIGHGAIIAAGSVVTKNVEPYTIVGGMPAKVIKKRFTDSHIEQLLHIKWWYFPEDILTENQKRFCSSQIDEFIEWSLPVKMQLNQD